MRKKQVFALLLLSALMVSCASNKNKPNTEDNGSPEIQAPVDVGSIHTRLELVEVGSTENADVQIIAKVIEVLGYGANTQPIEAASNLRLLVPESVVEEHDIMGKSPGWAFDALISKSQTMSGSTQASWRIVEIRN